MTVRSKQINEMHCNQLIEDDFDLFVQFRKISFVSILMIRKTSMVLQKKIKPSIPELLDGPNRTRIS